MAFDSLKARVRKATRLALQEVGRQWVKRLRDAVDTPYPPASAPGEYPHRRTRTLQRSFKYKVKKQAEKVEDLVVFVDHATFVKYGLHGYNYHFDLEHGRASTNLKPRPHFHPVKRAFQPEIYPIFHSEFQRRMVELEDAAGGFDSSDAAADFPASGGDSGLPV